MAFLTGYKIGFFFFFFVVGGKNKYLCVCKDFALLKKAIGNMSITLCSSIFLFLSTITCAIFHFGFY